MKYKKHCKIKAEVNHKHKNFKCKEIKIALALLDNVRTAINKWAQLNITYKENTIVIEPNVNRNLTSVTRIYEELMRLNQEIDLFLKDN